MATKRLLINHGLKFIKPRVIDNPHDDLPHIVGNPFILRNNAAEFTSWVTGQKRVLVGR